MKKKATLKNEQGFSVDFDSRPKELAVIFSGDVVHFGSDAFLADITQSLQKKRQNIVFVNNHIGEWDSSLLVVVFEIIRLAQNLKVSYDVSALPDNVQDLIKLAFAVDRKPEEKVLQNDGILERIGKKTVFVWQTVQGVIEFCGESFAAVGRYFAAKTIMRKIDFLSALDDCGPRALPIVCLISFLVGLILAFVGAVQLRQFGAQIYVASLVTIGMCRIMGAIMVGIIMAGRTGSSYAATIGTMQVNEELDALQTMGLSRMEFLVLPRLLALITAIPILTMLADFMGMLGGAFVGVILIGLPHQEYWKYAFDAFNLSNFLVGIFHGFVFGIIIALCGCYQGLNCGRNADSVGVATTRSVVSAIVAMIVATGIITVACQELGI